MKQNHKYIVTTVLILLFSIVNSILIDLYILPKKTVKDNIISYSDIILTTSSKFGRSTKQIGYEFYTEKNLKFSTDKVFIEENSVVITHTAIFKNITQLKTKNDDYSNKLISDLNGITPYFYIVLSISTTASLLLLLFKKNITLNEFQNIILFNLFMLFCISIIFIST